MADATLPKPTDENEDVKPAEAPVDGNLPIDPNRVEELGVKPPLTRPTVGRPKPKPAQPAKQEPAKTPQTESEQPEPPAGPPPERED